MRRLKRAGGAAALLILCTLCPRCTLVYPAVARAELVGPLWGGAGQTVFEHTRAYLRDPHFGVRIYAADAVPGTLREVSSPNAPDADARAAAPDGRHVFCDVAIGERAPLVGWYDASGSRSPRHTRGILVSLDLGAFALLDLNAQSTGVINTDYRAGLSIDLRPWWWDWADVVSLSIGYFHQSTHLGDEYVLSAATIQSRSSPPRVNPFLPYRANPAVEAFPVLVSLDAPGLPEPLALRVYGGATLFAFSQLPNGRSPEYRAGAELHWGPRRPAELPDGRGGPGDGSGDERLHRRGFGTAPGLGNNGGRAALAQALPRRADHAFALAYEVLLQQRYLHLGPEPGPPRFAEIDGAWATHHAVFFYLYNLDTERSSSNAVALGVELLWGRLQHGQLIEYATTRTVAGSVSYYW